MTTKKFRKFWVVGHHLTTFEAGYNSAPSLKEENENLKGIMDMIKKMTNNSAIRVLINKALTQS